MNRHESTMIGAVREFQEAALSGPLPTPRSEQDALVDAMPGAQLAVYEGFGHSPHWEEPERFASDLASFVETVN